MLNLLILARSLRHSAPINGPRARDKDDRAWPSPLPAPAMSASSELFRKTKDVVVTTPEAPITGSCTKQRSVVLSSDRVIVWTFSLNKRNSMLKRI